jgi:glycosyltransferase involved in cell wall biosynthesis
VKVKRVCYIISDVDKALSFEWVATGLKDDFDLTFILIGKEGTQLQKFLLERSIRVSLIQDHGNYLVKCISMYKLLKALKPDIVHIHLWRAMLIGLSVSFLLRIPKRIFTRHHATIHHNLYKGGLKWDRVCNFLATDIIAISPVVEEILVDWEQASPKKVSFIPHGFDFSYFDAPSGEQISILRSKYSVPANAFVVGVISRYTVWKGVQFIIPAFQQFIREIPNAHLVLANAQGDYAKEIRGKLRELPEGSYTEIKFENELSALYRLFDVFVHVPTDRYAEAFGQTYVEPLIAGVPSIFTISGIASEFVVHEGNALVAKHEDSVSIFQNLLRLHNDLELRQRLAIHGREVVTKFSLHNFLESLKILYSK